MAINPPFQDACKILPKDSYAKDDNKFSVVQECDLPVINFNRLTSGHKERASCMKEMAEAAREWGFFQVINHGVPRDTLKRMLREQKKVFHQPFKKKTEYKFLNLPPNSYRWGNPKAARLSQYSWSEAFHVPLTDISRMKEKENLRSTIQAFAKAAAILAQSIAEILAQQMGVRSSFFAENCTPSNSYLRMNRYPPCPLSSIVYGLVPHTDSGFLTILYEDQVGGLQLRKNGAWLSVRPNPEALLINIGDLFQAFSNDAYKSIQHRVVASQKVERFTVAYFYCPSNDAVVQSCRKPAVYRKFSFREYRQQILKDVEATGDKVGLSRFVS